MNSRIVVRVYSALVIDRHEVPMEKIFQHVGKFSFEICGKNFGLYLTWNTRGGNDKYVGGERDKEILFDSSYSINLDAKEIICSSLLFKRSFDKNQVKNLTDEEWLKGDKPEFEKLLFAPDSTPYL